MLSALPIKALGAGAQEKQERSGGDHAGRWSTSAFFAAEPVVDAVLAHPFVEGLAKGTLEKDVFLWYLAQNAPYLESYALSFEALGKRLPEADRALARRWIEETLATLAWTKDLYGRLAGHPLEASPWREASPTLRLYADFEAVAAARGDPAVAMAALLPCFTMYQHVGRHVARIRVLEGNPYAEWVSGYGTPEYDETVALAVGLADRLASEASPEIRGRMTKAYLTSCRLEWMLWSAAMKKESWPLQ